MPMPLRSAARAASTTAPGMPFPAPTIARCFRTPLCASKRIEGILARTHSPSTSIGNCCPLAPGFFAVGDISSPISRTTISPQQSLASSVPRFRPPKLKVMSAVTHAECCPVVASSPLGTSSEATRAPRPRSSLIVAIASPIFPRGSPSKPVPSSASTTIVALSSTESANFTKGIAASLSATASGDFPAVGLATSTTMTSTPVSARVRATTQPSPPLFPGPVKTTAPSPSLSV